MERKNAWETYDKSQEKKVMKLAEQYRQFISAGKTERECVRLTEKMAREAGYISLEEALTSGDTLKPGDKVYAIHKKKLAVLFQIGTEPLEKGMNILGAHIDSPRLDLKQNPLYEDGEMALLDTHYYGGIKKYQWAAIPLALHGVVARKDGTVVELAIGEDPSDPVLGISDLLIHLSGEQLQKKAAVVVEGENLNIIVGSKPLKTLFVIQNPLHLGRKSLKFLNIPCILLFCNLSSYKSKLNRKNVSCDKLSTVCLGSRYRNLRTCQCIEHIISLSGNGRTYYIDNSQSTDSS